MSSRWIVTYGYGKQQGSPGRERAGRPRAVGVDSLPVGGAQWVKCGSCYAEVSVHGGEMHETQTGWLSLFCTDCMHFLFYNLL